MKDRFHHQFRIVAAALAVLAAGAWWTFRPEPVVVENAQSVPQQPRIRPDYRAIVLPPNIAPMNFVVREDGRQFAVKIHGPTGEPIEVAGRSPSIEIPGRPWRALLSANRGKDLQWEICIKTDGQWRRFQPIVNHVADDEIDEHLVFRMIGPVHNGWSDVSIWQQNLANFERSLVVDGSSCGEGCVNCHSFAANDSKRMLVGLRSPSLGSATLFAEDGNAKKLAIRIGYTAWHPSATMAACSCNKTRQFFHAAGPEVRDVIDLKSSLAYFRIDTREFHRIPGACDDEYLATYPTWTPDGKSLYFCRAPVLWTTQDVVPPQGYADLKYDLMHISYDIETDRWGTPETVLSAEETGMSILLPRVSPDGKYLLFCMCKYGCFPVYQPNSDLYLMDLAKGTYAKCPVNSRFSESWHSWSSNSRWIAFSSKRRGGTFTRCYLAYFDGEGQLHKPFVVPQRDPEFYDSLLKTISVPELVTSKVQVHPAAMMRAARSKDAIELSTEPGSAPKAEDSQPYQQVGSR